MKRRSQISEIFVTLRNGIQMPVIGLGMMHIYGTECVKTICEGVNAGYRLIDTAAVYGNEDVCRRPLSFVSEQNARGNWQKI